MNVNEICRDSATDANGDAYHCSRLVWGEVSGVAFDSTFERRRLTYGASRAAMRNTSYEERHAL